MTAWGTPALRDAATIALLERDGWSGPRDYLVDCAWCASPFWRRASRGGTNTQVWCSPSCRHAAYHRRALARGWRPKPRRSA